MLIDQVGEIFRKIVDGSDWRFDGLSVGHLQSQVKSDSQVPFISGSLRDVWAVVCGCIVVSHLLCKVCV